MLFWQFLFQLVPFTGLPDSMYRTACVLAVSTISKVSISLLCYIFISDLHEAATDFLPLTPGIFPLSDACVVIDKIHSAIAVSSLFWKDTKWKQISIPPYCVAETTNSINISNQCLLQFHLSSRFSVHPLTQHLFTFIGITP